MAANTRWEFSPDGRLVLSISSDNRLRLFDVVSARGVRVPGTYLHCLTETAVTSTLFVQAGGGLRQQYVEKDHFSFRYTCCTWTQTVTWQDKVGSCFIVL